MLGPCSLQGPLRAVCLSGGWGRGLGPQGGLCSPGDSDGVVRGAPGLAGLCVSVPAAFLLWIKCHSDLSRFPPRLWELCSLASVWKTPVLP